MTASAVPVKNNLVLSIIALLLFWPVGLFALLKAVKVNGLAASGDVAGAEAAATSAKKLSMIAIIVAVVLYVVICGLTVLAGSLAATSSTM
jgi:hypothetical protein